MTGTRGDVIVILGGGIGVDGEPSPATVRRADRAVALYRAGRAGRIIMSGGYGMFDPRPLRSEAEAMAEIAVGGGCEPDDIIVEAESRDTIGNIWFTKRLLHENRWHDVIVVTSDWHVTRVRYLCETIWGPRYRLTAEPIAGDDDGRPAGHIALWEAGLLSVSRRWFAGVRPGDDAAIGAVLATEHPIYADRPGTTLAELAAMVTRQHAGPVDAVRPRAECRRGAAG